MTATRPRSIRCSCGSPMANPRPGTLALVAEPGCPTTAVRGPLKGALSEALNGYPDGLSSVTPADGLAGAMTQGDHVDAANDIAEFLASRRAKITPEQAGLPSYGKRRVPGLRREEVASLAGVSADYYRRLERGQVSGASELVLEALARALQLDDAERAHLFDLARAASPVAARRARPARTRVRPVVQRLLDQIEAPAIVSTVRGDYLAANALGRALYAPVFDSPEQPANSARFTFLDPAARDFYPEWERAGLRARRGAALAGRQQPLRPQPAGPHRRAVDAQRRVPRPLGGAQRALPPHGHQAPASSGRRRAGAQLRDADARRRRRPAHGALHRRAGLGLPAGAGSAGQLDGHAETWPRGACAASPRETLARLTDARRPGTRTATTRLRGPQDDEPCDHPCPDDSTTASRSPPSASASSRARPRRRPPPSRPRCATATA